MSTTRSAHPHWSVRRGSVQRVVVDAFQVIDCRHAVDHAHAITAVLALVARIVGALPSEDVGAVAGVGHRPHDQVCTLELVEFSLRHLDHECVDATDPGLRDCDGAGLVTLDHELGLESPADRHDVEYALDPLFVALAVEPVHERGGCLCVEVEVDPRCSTLRQSRSHVMTTQLELL